jgi:hypothetical protein
MTLRISLEQRSETAVAECMATVKKTRRVIVFELSGAVRAVEIHLHSYFFRLVIITISLINSKKNS